MTLCQQRSNSRRLLLHSALPGLLCAGGSVAIQRTATLGRRYQLQSATNLPAASWANEGATFSGTAGVLTTNLPIGSEPTKFFRLQLLDN